MTWNKLFVAIVAAALVGVALPAGAYHIDHHRVTSNSSVTWVAGTGVFSCEADWDNFTRLPLMGQGGLCYVHNHTETVDPGSVGPAAWEKAGAPFETTLLGHHTGTAHDGTPGVVDGHADHGVYNEDDDDDFPWDDNLFDPTYPVLEEPVDNDIVVDGGLDIGIPVTDAGCGQIGDDEWTALNLTKTHQGNAPWFEAIYQGQISGVDSAVVDASGGLGPAEHLVYHEKTACLTQDGHVAVFVHSADASVATANTGVDFTTGSYTAWGQGETDPCPDPGDSVCSSTGGPSPVIR